MCVCVGWGRDWKECSGGDIANKSPPPPFLPTTTVNAKLFRRKNTQGFPRAGEEEKKLGFIDALDYWPPPPLSSPSSPALSPHPPPLPSSPPSPLTHLTSVKTPKTSLDISHYPSGRWLILLLLDRRWSSLGFLHAASSPFPLPLSPPPPPVGIWSVSR